jgi:transcriptional regulator with XRE-family HTH domain
MSIQIATIAVICLCVQKEVFKIMNSKQTAERIKMCCKENKISVAVLLKECDLDKGLIYELTRRSKAPSIETFEKIANHLDCSVDYLIGRTDNPKTNK